MDNQQDDACFKLFSPDSPQLDIRHTHAFPIPSTTTPRRGFSLSLFLFFYLSLFSLLFLYSSLDCRFLSNLYQRCSTRHINIVGFLLLSAWRRALLGATPCSCSYATRGGYF